MNDAYLRQFLSESSRKAKRSEIREILKLSARPEIISLAGGMPSPEAFPIAELVELMPSLLMHHGTAALQYGPTEGDLGLREQLIRLLVETEDDDDARLTPEQILVTSASQQGLDLVSRVFITPGDMVLCGLPSYLGALSAFTACGARLSGIQLDSDGLRTDLLRQRLIELRRRGVRPKFIYTIPDFQNPTGATLSLKRRRQMLSIAREFQMLVLEDSPYRQLRYVGNPIPSLASLDRDGRVISLFTFSKVLSPGLRLGWIVADPAIISRLVVAKQSVDLCTSGLSQLVVREYLKAGRLPAQLERIRQMYGMKRRAMLAALAEHIDPSWNVSWTRPEGGLFLWLTLTGWMNAGKLLKKALDRNLAFVVGHAFHFDGTGENTLRLNFSYPDIRQIETAVQRLAECIDSMVREHVAKRERVPAVRSWNAA